MAFELKQFITGFEQAPCVGELGSLKKTELIAVCKHYNVKIKTSMRKNEIKQVLVETLIDEDIMSESEFEI